MLVYISNKIYVEYATSELFEWCKQHLEFPNPEYSKKERMGLWTGNIEPMIVLWERKGNTAILPFGVLNRFLESFQPDTISYSPEKRPSFGAHDYQSHIELFDYQEAAVKATQNKSGVLVMPCGAGKTQIALALISQYGAKTLWLTHTQELLNQSKDRALSCFDIDEDRIGTITAGKINVGESLTFATVQTMSRVDLESYKDYWDVVIVDECHKAVGTPTKLMMFYKVVSQLNAPVKLGLTATPKRNDGLERCMYALLGDILYQVPEEAVKKNTVPTLVYQLEDDSYEMDIVYATNPDGTLNYNRIIESLCHCEKRNRKIAEIVNQINSSGQTCLVLSDRVEHLTELRKLVGEDYTAQIFSMGSSKKARQARRACIEDLKQRNIRCLFATYQLAKEGLDIPSLNTVLFATPKKDPITVIQSCGRVGRKSPGKEFGIVVDLVDSRFHLFVSYSKKRRSMYKNKKFQIF